MDLLFRPTRDEHGRLWTNSLTDGWVLERLAREISNPEVGVVTPPRPVEAGPILLDGNVWRGTVHARRRREHQWAGLVLLEREYAPCFWHLVLEWLPADRIRLLD